MKNMDAEQFLHSLGNLPRREYQKTRRQLPLYLTRLQAFLDILGNPERKIPHYVHVTGTSGKGSVATFLSEILSANGETVGLYTSPEPTYLRERWQINGIPISPEELVDATEILKTALDEYSRRAPFDYISYFDATTALAFLLFAQRKVSWAVFEVGLGGRYDSTNVIPWKDAAVITTVGLDHTEVLGKTKEKIAFDKSGIISFGTKVFTMVAKKNLLRIISKEAKSKQAELHAVDSGATDIRMKSFKTDFNYNGQDYQISVLGRHQVKNAILALEVAKHLKVDERAIKEGLKKTKLPVRMEMVSSRPYIVVDGAHNPDKVDSTVETMRAILKERGVGGVRLVVGFSADKDWRKMMKSLLTLKPKSIACTRNIVDSGRVVADPREIAKYCREHSKDADIDIFLNPLNALEWSERLTEEKDTLLVTGSFYIAGFLRRKFIDGV